MRSREAGLRLSLAVEHHDPVSLGWRAGALEALSPWLAAIGPVAVIEGATRAPTARGRAATREIAVLLLDPEQARVGTLLFQLPTRGVAASTRVFWETLRDRTLVALERAYASGKPALVNVEIRQDREYGGGIYV